MNILIVTTMYPPIRTGTSYYSRNLALALHALGHQISVATVHNTEPYSDDVPFVVERLPAIHLPVKNYFRHLRVTSLFPASYLRLLRLARSTSAEIILLINHYLDIAFPAIFVSRLARIPLVVSIGTQMQSPDPFRHRVLNFLDRLICGRMIFPHCRRLIPWDDQTLQYLKDVHGDSIEAKCEIANFGVNGDPEVFRSHSHDYALHNQILGIGAVVEQRDFTALVQAFSQLAHEFPDLRLRIIGHVYSDAAVRLAAELGLADRVTFTGELPHNEVLAALKNSDVYFCSLTGRYVGLGTATLESMLMGVPTMVNAYPGILGRAVMRPGEDALLIDALEPGAIAAGLRSLIADPARRRRIGTQGRAFVDRHLNWTKVARDIAELLGRVAAEHRLSRT